MKERPASEVEAACDAAFAPLRWVPLRYGGAKGGGSFWEGSLRPSDSGWLTSISKMVVPGEWHFTLRERYPLMRMTFPSRRQLQ